MKTNNKQHLTHFYNNVCPNCKQSKLFTITLNLNQLCFFVQQLHHAKYQPFIQQTYKTMYKQIKKQL